jgi:hypothetical protein
VGYDHLVASALHIYLQDHLAGATFGLELVQRCRRNNEGTEFAEHLAELTAEIAEDRRTLQRIMRDVGAAVSHTKVAAGWTLEKIRRLKPNGSLFEYTPLARLAEFESLAIGIAGKRAMWRALEAVASREARLNHHDFSRLSERADDQLLRVEALRLEAARTAFRHLSTEPRARASAQDAHHRCGEQGFRLEQMESGLVLSAFFATGTLPVFCRPSQVSHPQLFAKGERNTLHLVPQRSLTSTGSAPRSTAIVWPDARRRLGRASGFTIQTVPTFVTSGAWVCPYATTWHSGNQVSSRSCRPDRGPGREHRIALTP